MQYSETRSRATARWRQALRKWPASRAWIVYSLSWNARLVTVSMSGDQGWGLAARRQRQRLARYACSGPGKDAWSVCPTVSSERGPASCRRGPKKSAGGTSSSEPAAATRVGEVHRVPMARHARTSHRLQGEGAKFLPCCMAGLRRSARGAARTGAYSVPYDIACARGTSAASGADGRLWMDRA